MGGPRDTGGESRKKHSDPLTSADARVLSIAGNLQTHTTFTTLTKLLRSTAARLTKAWLPERAERLYDGAILLAVGWNSNLYHSVPLRRAVQPSAHMFAGNTDDDEGLG